MNRLKELRKEKGVTQKEVADEVGVKKLTISRWENSEELSLKSDKLQQLADYFKVSIQYLLGHSSDRKDVLKSTFDLLNADNEGQVDLEDYIALSEIAIYKSVDVRDKIVSNLKNYYDYDGKNMRKKVTIKDEDRFQIFLKDHQERMDSYQSMLLVGLTELRNDIKYTIMDLLSLEGDKLETVKHLIEIVADNPLQNTDDSAKLRNQST